MFTLFAVHSQTTSYLQLNFEQIKCILQIYHLQLET